MVDTSWLVKLVWVPFVHVNNNNISCDMTGEYILTCGQDMPYMQPAVLLRFHMIMVYVLPTLVKCSKSHVGKIKLTLPVDSSTTIK